MITSYHPSKPKEQISANSKLFVWCYSHWNRLQKNKLTFKSKVSSEKKRVKMCLICVKFERRAFCCVAPMRCYKGLKHYFIGPQLRKMTAGLEAGL